MFQFLRAVLLLEKDMSWLMSEISGWTWRGGIGWLLGDWEWSVCPQDLIGM